jgi:hypothetical protein
MRLSALLLSVSMLLGAGCAVDPTASQGRTGNEVAARAHEVFSEDFKNAGRQEQAKYHAEKAREARERAIDADCFTCSLLDGVFD